MTSVMGRLKQDTVWDGEVCLHGDVVVPEGTTLRVEAGARISFGERPRWSCAVFRRPADHGDSIEVSVRDHCDLVVEGTLEVHGAAASPVCIGVDETPWGGITGFGTARIQVEHTYVAGAPRFSLQAFDDATIAGMDSHYAGAEFGAWMWGTSRLEWQGGAMGATRASVLCAEGARAWISGSEDRSGEGISAIDHALVRVEAACFRGPRKHCAVAKDHAWVKLRDCTLRDARMDVVCEDDAQVEVHP